jgi:lysophospholipase L1-like esterase
MTSASTSSSSLLPTGKPAELSLRRKVFFTIVMTFVLFAGLETVIRVGAYFVYHRSPYFLYYGFREQSADDNPQGHNVPLKGYSKFPASTVLHQYGMFQEPTPIRVNTLGLRGEDFAILKPTGTFRVICMGESSTFGFFDRDEFTYPSLTQQIFQQGGGLSGNRVEVINAGIPHANSDHILAMERGELLDYKPDVLTLYAGFNDAVLMMDETTLQTTMRWLHGHFATYVALKRLVTAMGGPMLYSRWSGYLSDVGPASVGRQVELHVARYEKNVRDMVALARERGARFVFIKQPIVMQYHDAASHWQTTTYAARAASARAEVEAGRRISADQATELVHFALMGVLDRLAKELDIPVVDNIVIMDAHSEYYASYVHITEDGNRALAAAIAETIGRMSQ